MTIIEEINEQIESYHNIEIAAHNLEFIMGIRKSLSIKAYHLGVLSAKAKRQSETSIAQRKIKFFKSKLNNIKEGIGKAETIAESEIELERENESNWVGLFGGYKIILEQVNQVLSSINQDISVLRLEYKNQM